MCIARQAQASAEVPAVGQRAQAFVRPEAIELSKKPYDPTTHPNASTQIVDSVLFNGANSQLILRDQMTGAEMNVALPQTGEFRDLKRGDVISFGWASQQTRCYRAGIEK